MANERRGASCAAGNRLRDPTQEEQDDAPPSERRRRRRRVHRKRLRQVSRPRCRCTAGGGVPIGGPPGQRECPWRRTRGARENRAGSYYHEEGKSSVRRGLQRRYWVEIFRASSGIRPLEGLFPPRGCRRLQKFGGSPPRPRHLNVPRIIFL